MDVQLPDGSIIKGVPDGTTKADLAQKLQANGRKVPAEWLSPKDQPKALSWGPSSAFKGSQNPLVDTAMSYGKAIGDALKGEGTGIMDPAFGVIQGVEHVLGRGEQADEAMKQRERELASEGVSKGWRTAGNVMAPTNYAVPAGAGGNALARIGTAALAGAVTNASMPVTEGDYATEKAKQAGVGAAAGGVTSAVAGVLGKAVNPMVRGVQAGIDRMKRWLGAEMPSSLESGAVHKVLEQFGKDQSAGGPKLTDVMDVLNAARTAGKPLTLADMGGDNVKALSGYVTRQPGEGMTQARQLMATRDSKAAERLAADIDQHITSGPSMKQTADALTKARAASARPLYEEALKPGSTAPLQSQLSTEFGRIQTERQAAERELAAAEREVTANAARQAQRGVGADIRGADATKATGQGVEAAKAKLAALDAQEAKTTGVLREAQRAEAAGERGGVWSSRIQQFLDDPILKAGLSKGLKVQRLEALAEGKEFNPADYAIKGFENGEPVAGAVPNMRTLDAAKRGLDEILEGYRDKTTGRLVLDQQGRAIDQVRRAFVDELDRLNPSYKVARGAWSGPSQSLDAMKAGSEIFNRTPEQVAENFSRLSPNDKEFFRLGVADKLRERIAKTGVGGDEAKAIIKNNWTKSQLRPLFDSQEQFDKFIDAAMMESKMFDTAFRLKGGSHTAERLAGDKAFESDVEAAHAGVGMAKNALTGNLIGAARDALKMRQALGWRKNQELNNEIARLLFDPNLTLNALQKSAGTKLLESFPGPHTQNFLAQGTRNALAAMAPAAAMMANQSVQP